MKPNAKSLKISHKIIISILSHGWEISTYVREYLLFIIALKIKHTHLARGTLFQTALTSITQDPSIYPVQGKDTERAFQWV